MELLRGGDIETSSRKCAVTAATLSSWRDSFPAGGQASLKIRHEGLADEQGRRMKPVILELAVSRRPTVFALREPLAGKIPCRRTGARSTPLEWRRRGSGDHW